MNSKRLVSGLKRICIAIILCSLHLLLYGQNHVVSGSEVYSTISIDLRMADVFSTGRSATPGFFAFADNGKFTDESPIDNVDGYVKYYAGTGGLSSFTFPVGTGNVLRSLSATNIPSAAVIATAWIEGDPTTTADPTDGSLHPVTTTNASLMEVSSAGQWDWLDISGTSQGTIITVLLPEMSGFASSQALRLAGWNGNQWVDLSGAATASGNSEGNTLSGVMQAGITALAVGKIAIPLPVVLTSFYGISDECNVVLHWQTGSEINVLRFEVQSSANGLDYQVAGTVQAGNLREGQRYSYILPQEDELLYYRLRMIDQDGSFSYSKSIRISSGCEKNKQTLEVFPNPVPAGDLHKLTVRYFPAGYQGTATALLVNTSGQIIEKKSISVSRNTTVSVLFDIHHLPAGTYLVQIIPEREEKRIVKKIIRR